MQGVCPLPIIIGNSWIITVVCHLSVLIPIPTIYFKITICFSWVLQLLFKFTNTFMINICELQAVGCLHCEIIVQSLICSTLIRCDIQVYLAGIHCMSSVQYLHCCDFIVKHIHIRSYVYIQLLYRAFLTTYRN